VPVIAGTVFTWLGMVLAISFLEAPLKFRAPDVTLRIGLGIGRLVFRALTIAEAILATVVVVTAVVSEVTTPVLVAAAVAVLVLLAQLAAIRPVLTKRSDRVLADATAAATMPRSRGHLVYVAAEVVKVAALVVAGVSALANF
jgi:hypothetical protein